MTNLKINQKLCVHIVQKKKKVFLIICQENLTIKEITEMVLFHSYNHYGMIEILE